jgi:Phosphodiester glycosidase
MTGASGQQWDDQRYDGQAQDGYGYDQRGYRGQAYGAQREDDQTYGVQQQNGQPQDGQWHGDQSYGAQENGQHQGARQYEGYADQPTWQYGGYADQPVWQEGYRDPRGGQGYDRQGYDRQGYDRQGYAGYNGHQEQQSYQERQGYPGTEYGAAPGAPGQRKVHFRRLRRFARRRSVRVVAAILGVFLIWVMFSAGQAAFKNNGQGFSANLAEWARDHYLGPVVTFGEWLSYQPPKVGGKPSFSYAVPKGERITTNKGKHKGFVPDIPPTVKTLAAGAPLAGEGQWRVVEKVKGEPAILVTFLRDGGQYTSYSNGIASIDQRLVKFSLRPGTEDPGSAPGDGGNWGVSNYIPPGQRTGVLATFNGGFKLDSAGGGFYLNGMYHGSLVNGTASIVYYKNGTIKIGEWGRDFTMNSKIEGVRQNLELLVDHGKLSPDANSAVKTGAWGATLGGGYWVWRSGIGITKDGRIIFVYGQALDAQDLGELLVRAGAVEGMQMDINPEWMKFDYYQADGHPGDPTPVPLLPAQQANPYFTAVYAR